MRRAVLSGLIVSLLATGCVSKGRYDALVESTNESRAEERTEMAALEEQAKRLQGRLTELQSELEKANAKLADQDASSRAELERMRRAQLASEARAALFRDLASKLAKMIDAGDLSIVLRDGRMVLQLPNDILFDTGRTDVKPSGRKALDKVAAALKTVRGHNFQVAGHTDDVPIETERFASNWELSSARALVVVHFLVARGLEPRALSAAGYGEFDPVASNGNDSGRAKNRRTEIVLQPNVDEIVAVPTDK